MAFSKKGYRQSQISKKKLNEAHIKGFYKTLDKVIKVSDELSKLDIEINESNIDIEAKKILGRDLDSMERVMILGKLSNDETEDNN